MLVDTMQRRVLSPAALLMAVRLLLLWIQAAVELEDLQAFALAADVAGQSGDLSLPGNEDKNVSAGCLCVSGYICNVKKTRKKRLGLWLI